MVYTKQAGLEGWAPVSSFPVTPAMCFPKNGHTQDSSVPLRVTFYHELNLWWQIRCKNMQKGISILQIRAVYQRKAWQNSPCASLVRNPEDS